MVGRLLSNVPGVTIDYDIDASQHFLRYVKTAQENLYFFSSPEYTVMDRANEPWRRDDFAMWHRANIDYFQNLHHSFRSGTTHWGSSTCWTYLFRDIIWHWYPDAKIVFMHRDPRDQWASFKHLPMPPGKNSFRYFKESMETIPDDDRLIHLQYHEVVADPTIPFKRLGFELPQDYLDGMVEVFLGRTRGSTSEDWRDSLRDGIVQNRVGRWKRDLTSNEVALVTVAFPELCDYYDEVSDT